MTNLTSFCCDFIPEEKHLKGGKVQFALQSERKQPSSGGGNRRTKVAGSRVSAVRMQRMNRK